MADTTPVLTFTKQIEDLKFDFVVSVSVLGGVCIFLLSLSFGLVIWNIQLSKKIKKMDPLINFKLQRPKLFTSEEPRVSETARNFYDNPTYPPKNPMSQAKVHSDRNPIAKRSSASFDNGNFSFGAPNKATNSFRSPDYMDQDSRFY